MKVAVVYTSTTPELVEMVNTQLNSQFEGKDLTIMNYKDPSILQEARDNGYVTFGCARRLMNMYEQAVRDGADILFNICSSVGDVAKLAKPLYEMMGIKFVRIDEDMAMAAVASGKRIGVIATLPTTLEPTKRLVQDCADVLGKEVVIVDALADGAFGLNQEQFKQMLIDTASKVKKQVDVLLFAQGSMAYAEKDVSAALGLPVYSSIKFGAAAVKAAADLIK
ncbi:MAG: aspartate/glutamate racemase family protein [Acetivibrionales bacterium]|jgi:Asp/Glu/hydantoin racemase